MKQNSEKNKEFSMRMTLMTQVMNHISVGHPIRKLILLKLAHDADEKGECTSIPCLAQYCETTDRTAQKHLKVLVSEGFVRIQ
ncbi:MAG: hypothetical protein HamCj_13750 [Candidatus Hamiltonella defensa (Ceratovacuna japonica)]|uniref:helix-turn-helix transcriptional regulator n=1 Tax=Candidatus Williamhamiltonella defendens TaxID=138072 RepID=UPI0015835F67|nr:helix-turn-helix transcriptional regulator [Candidatus Hamiltonella defensa]